VIEHTNWQCLELFQNTNTTDVNKNNNKKNGTNKNQMDDSKKSVGYEAIQNVDENDNVDVIDEDIQKLMNEVEVDLPND